MTGWHFEADYFTACNCEWGCPCNFNAKPNEGHCMGWGAWRIDNGRFGEIDLAGTRFAVYYKFPGAIENGNGSACAYIDTNASAAQRAALETIATGKAGGGIFDLFGAQLVTCWLPTKFAPIEFDLSDSDARIRVEGYGHADSESLSYPDGSSIRPWLELPHGIEYKRGLMTNARRWWWRDGDLLASYANRYGAIARVKFTEQGCMG
jgi:hypothetical protein